MHIRWARFKTISLDFGRIQRIFRLSIVFLMLFFDEQQQKVAKSAVHWQWFHWFFSVFVVRAICSMRDNDLHLFNHDTKRTEKKNTSEDIFLVRFAL